MHWTKGETDEDAFNILKKILLEVQLIGGTGYIKGKHQCVCFTESPVKFFYGKQVKYKPFGVKFRKKIIFAMGGRPVIYQPDHEWSLLPEEIQWRHMTYNPSSTGVWTDFTWEREWRLKVETLAVPPNATVYVKNQDFVHRLRDELENEYWAQASYESAMLGTDWPQPAEMQFEILSVD